MKVNVFSQIAVVHSDNAADFQNQFNSKIRELADYEPKPIFVEREGLCAIITYTMKERVIENVSDEYHEAGIHYKCKHCPYIERPDDRRIKHCSCGLYGTRVHTDQEACDLFYSQLKEGLIEPLTEHFKRSNP